ncbi:hypothetical protein [Aliamphritea spongicola]|nr:hypothetical protein [Aliamphritea spongicola]
MQGFQYSAKILNAGFPVIEWVPTEEVAGKMIMKNRLDLVFADVVVMQQAIRDHGLTLKPMLPVFSTQPMYPSFNVGQREKCAVSMMQSVQCMRTVALMRFTSSIPVPDSRIW